MIGLPVDWEHAFKACALPRASHGYTGDVSVTFAELGRVISKDERQGDMNEMDLIGLFETYDGRHVVIRAQCDTTGWGCLDTVSTIEVAATAEDAIRWSLTDAERERLRLPLLW